MATSNPAFSQDMFAGFQQVYGAPRSLVTTVQGTIGKTSLLLAILSATALWSWYAMAAGQLQIVVLPVAGIAGFVLAMITIFKPTVAPWTAPVYAAMEGVFLGALSQMIETEVDKLLPGNRPPGGDAHRGHADGDAFRLWQRDDSRDGAAQGWCRDGHRGRVPVLLRSR